MKLKSQIKSGKASRLFLLMLVLIYLIPTSLKAHPIDYKNSALWKAYISEFEQKLRDDPKDIHSYNHLGMLYMEAKFDDCAEPLFKKSIEVNYSQTFPHNALAILYERRTDYNGAIMEYETLSALEPENAGFLNLIALMYRRQGDRKHELEYYKRSFRVNSNQTHIQRKIERLENELAAIELNPNK